MKSQIGLAYGTYNESCVSENNSKAEIMLEILIYLDLCYALYF